MDALKDQKRLIDGLARALAATGGTVEQFETHISRVLVAGKYAFKFKKALQLPFLDFSTLDARRFCCQEECRLNRRLAPDLYIDVVPVAGDSAHPVIGGAGEAIEYAVRMHAFEQYALWSHRVAHGLLEAGEIDALAWRLARFHRDAAAAPPDAGWGSVPAIAATFEQTLAGLSVAAADKAGQDRLSALQDWEAGQRSRLAAAFQHRKTQGMIRECHGDLHCGNVLKADDQVQVFDCIEFEDSLRWIDVIDDLAFIHMDLSFHGRPDLAARLLSQYLENTGDYAGLAVLPYYRVHRALVRAKVMLLRAEQPDMLANDREASRRDALSYLAFADACSRPRRVALTITHGYSGSGKTSFARHAVQVLGAIQLRSDVERKRSNPCGEPLYGDAATGRTYAHLRALARGILAAGWPVIVDATCLKAAQRELFRVLAADMGVPFFIFDVRAARATMRSRVESRGRAGCDASDADLVILEGQLRSAQPLEDMTHVIVVDTEPGMDLERARAACAPVLASLDAHEAH